MSEEPTKEEEAPELDTSLRDELEGSYVDEDKNEDAAEETAEKETETKESSDEEKSKDSDHDKGGAIGDADGKKTPSGINAPIGFSPESREVWKDVPELVKEQIQRRETEIESAMANTGEFRRTHTALEKLAQSYAPILAAEGAENPMQAIEGMFRTVAELRVGSPQQVATKMAQLIGHYGVDITMLDQALSGQPTQTEEMTAMQKMLDSRLAPIQELLSQQTQTKVASDAANKDAVNTELQEFSKSAEFLADVRMDMADLIDLASKHGRKMDFKEAYDKACALNPSVSSVIDERKQADVLKNSGEKLESKKNAASSLASSSGESAVGAGGPSTLRGEIESIWDAHTE